MAKDLKQEGELPQIPLPVCSKLANKPSGTVHFFPYSQNY